MWNTLAGRHRTHESGKGLFHVKHFSDFSGVPPPNAAFCVSRETRPTMNSLVAMFHVKHARRINNASIDCFT